jgi:hypothetical protein
MASPDDAPTPNVAPPAAPADPSGDGDRRKPRIELVAAVISLAAAVVGGGGALMEAASGYFDFSKHLPWSAARPVAELERALEQRRGVGRACADSPAVANPGVALQAGDCLRLTLKSERDGWLYVVNESPDSAHGRPIFNFLWPPPGAGAARGRTDARHAQQVPEGSWWRVDEESGYERVWIVWAAQPLAQLERGRRAAHHQHGEVPEAAVWPMQAFFEKAVVVEADGNRLRSDREPLVHLLTLRHR